MFFLYCLILFLFVYTLPALALFPNLISSPGTISAIPIISIFIIGVITKILIQLNCFDQSIVILFSFCFLSVSMVRLSIYISKNKNCFNWNLNQFFISAFVIMIFIPIFLKMGLNSFSYHDEIYSWNMWAIQYVKGEPVDFYYTKYPYPQMLSIVIAYCYKLLGNIELQMPVKCMLSIFPLTMFYAIVTAADNKTYSQAIIGIFLSTLLLFGFGMHHKFMYALADPLMASSLLISVRLYIDSIKSDKGMYLLWLSLICGVVSAYSKQPALIWSLFAFPVLLSFSKFIKKNPIQTLTIAIISVTASLAWIFGEGSNFYSNEGVVYASQQGRNLIEQILFSANKYFVKKPLILFFLFAAAFSVFKVKANRGVFVLLIFPCLIAWFLYGSYDLRLGIHVVSLSALLLYCSGFAIPFLNENNPLWHKMGNWAQERIKPIIIFLVIISIVYPLAYVSREIYKKNGSINLYHGGKKTIDKYFGDISDFVYKNLYDNSEIVLWVPSNYIYGIFYGHTKMVRPNYIPGKPYLYENMVEEIIIHKPDYIFDAGNLGYGPATKNVKEIVDKFPMLFKEIKNGRSNEYGYILYKVNKSELSVILPQKRL